MFGDDCQNLLCAQFAHTPLSAVKQVFNPLMLGIAKQHQLSDDLCQATFGRQPSILHILKHACEQSIYPLGLAHWGVMNIDGAILGSKSRCQECCSEIQGKIVIHDKL